jgi:hypothetical protein
MSKWEYSQYASANQVHDPEFYEAKRREREAAIARGEDPYADFKKLVAERGHNSPIEKLYRRVTGKSKGTTKTSEPAAVANGTGIAEYQQLGAMGNGEVDEGQSRVSGSETPEAAGSVDEKTKMKKKRSLFGKRDTVDVAR